PQQQQGTLPHMMPQAQQVHHLIPQSQATSTQNRDHHQHSHLDMLFYVHLDIFVQKMYMHSFDLLVYSFL
ncbi:unnamed protein product, partial [Rotaria sp. Silwood1]